MDEPLLPKIEEKILKFWSDRDIFKKSLQNRADAKRFVFFEGPPTANARPAIHHLIGRAFKDIFVRYKTMRGYLVERRAGWDTHGLPVEIEVEKSLGLKNKKDIEQYGIAKFNAKAKESVWKYKDEWEKFTERIGFWLDMEHPYVTHATNYIETLWWIIKEIDNKKLLYEGHKVLPWCTRCGTALSSHEVAQGYEDVTDVSVYVKFKLESGQKIGKESIPENTYILAWTTTPWTLPGNLALAVGKSIKYQVVSIKGKNENYILAQDLVEKILNTKYEILNTITGKDLVGLKYESLFAVPALKSEKSYQIYSADFVTTTDGTGIVHTAVMYGEVDYELGKKVGLSTVHTVNDNGKFKDSVPELAGQYVKDPKTEKNILDYLQTKNLLFKTEPHTHSYPFCWRCKTVLLYYAKDSWFVGMSKLRKQLVKNNKKINWVPEHLRDGRFGEFIKEAKDWAFSRERYWGTPLPVWRCGSPTGECRSYQVVGSLEDLETSRHKNKNSFFLMRHTASTRDLDKGDIIISSKPEHDKYNLTNEGTKLAQEQAEGLKKQGGVDFIVASPFLRTKETAKIIADQLRMQYTTDERLKELDHGLSCEGQPKSACANEENRLTMDSKSEDSESWLEARKRMFEVVSEFNDKYEGKKILIVGHGDPLWLLETGLMGFDDARTVASRNSPLYLGQGEFHQVDFKNWPYDEDGSLNLHRPYIDEITLKCEKCGSESQRVKEVVDVWFDSGAMPYAQWHYPFENKIPARTERYVRAGNFEQNFPADFISEGIDQTRGWFYTLLAVSTLLGRVAPYKNVVSYSHVLDEKNRKMSKSLGNVIDPWEVMNQFGVDPIRWYFYSVSNPGETKSFSPQISLKQPKAFIGTILNSLNFFELYNQPSGRQVKLKGKPQGLLDSWLLSRLNNTLMQATKSLDAYNPTLASREIENFVVDNLSNWWIRRSRELFQRPENKKSLQNAVHFLQYILVELSKMTAPFMPFLSDHVYKRLGSFKESVHLEDWPKAKKRFINLELETKMNEVREVIAVGLAQRKNNNIKVRQPLSLITIKKTERFDSQLEALILAELNIKKVLYSPVMTESVILDVQITQELMLEGYARELMRQIQDMRKEAKYKIDEKAFLAWESNNVDVIFVFEKFGAEITKTTALKELSRGHNNKLVFDIQKEFELAPQVKVWLGIKK